jgi:hypothetical protein
MVFLSQRDVALLLVSIKVRRVNRRLPTEAGGVTQSWSCIFRPPLICKIHSPVSKGAPGHRWNGFDDVPKASFTSLQLLFGLRRFGDVSIGHSAKPRFTLPQCFLDALPLNRYRRDVRRRLKQLEIIVARIARVGVENHEGSKHLTIPGKNRLGPC